MSFFQESRLTSLYPLSKGLGVLFLIFAGAQQRKIAYQICGFTILFELLFEELLWEYVIAIVLNDTPAPFLK